MTSPYTLLLDRLARYPAAPWLTYVDPAAGTRAELSVASAVNAAVKVAHLAHDLATDRAIERPARVELRLSLHWQAWTLTVGLWAAGACVVLPGLEGEDAAGRPLDAVVVGPDAHLSGAELPETTWATALHPLGLPFAEPIAYPFEDLALAVRGQPDVPPVDRSTLDGPALAYAEGTVTHRQLADQAQRLAGGWNEHERVLTTLTWTDPVALVLGLILPAAESRSVVVLGGATPDAATTAPGPAGLAELCRHERVTATIGVTVAGLPRLDETVEGTEGDAQASF
jgi:uncharacterized protein (TIGR03089 family)